VITLSLLATPGLAAVGVLLLLFLCGAPVWWIGLVVTTHGRPSEAVVRTPGHRFLGPGGPDDPFADTQYEGDAQRNPSIRRG
jgi:hypothetical protein